MTGRLRIAAQDPEDLMYGQSVIVSARWILVISGLFLALWNPGPMSELRIQILFILLLAVANFYLQAQLLMRKPANSGVVYFASAADLVVVSVMIILGGGFESNIYVFYFPAMLALSVAFSPAATLLFAGGAASFYAFISLGSALFGDIDFQVLIARLIMMTAVAVCGQIYWRIERDRRGAAVKARKRLIAQLREAKAAGD
ncbi:MAG: hypothetical protein ACE5JF_00250 [Anaerolineales bacterium]